MVLTCHQYPIVDSTNCIIQAVMGSSPPSARQSYTPVTWDNTADTTLTRACCLAKNTTLLGLISFSRKFQETVLSKIYWVDVPIMQQHSCQLLLPEYLNFSHHCWRWMLDPTVQMWTWTGARIRLVCRQESPVWHPSSCMQSPASRWGATWHSSDVTWPATRTYIVLVFICIRHHYVEGSDELPVFSILWNIFQLFLLYICG